MTRLSTFIGKKDLIFPPFDCVQSSGIIRIGGRNIWCRGFFVIVVSGPGFLSGVKRQKGRRSSRGGRVKLLILALKPNKSYSFGGFWIASSRR